MIKRILVGLSGTKDPDALVEHAVEIARRHGASVGAVAALNMAELENVGPVPLGAGTAADDLRHHRVSTAVVERDRAVKRLVDECAAAQVSHTVLAPDGDPLELLASEARYYDLTMLSLHGMPDADGSGNPTALARLVSQGVRPVLAVAEPYRPIERVVVAYSGSMESAKTLKWFVQLRPWADPEVRIVHFGQNGRDGEGLLADAAAYCQAHGIAAETELVNENPKGLLAYAHGWGADLIVAGNSAKNLLLRRVLGETALELMRASDRSLFLAQ